MLRNIIMFLKKSILILKKNSFLQFVASLFEKSAINLLFFLISELINQ